MKPPQIDLAHLHYSRAILSVKWCMMLEKPVDDNRLGPRPRVEEKNARTVAALKVLPPSVVVSISAPTPGKIGVKEEVCVEKVGGLVSYLKSSGNRPAAGAKGLTIGTRGDERVERRACADPHGGGGHVGVVGPGPGSAEPMTVVRTRALFIVSCLRLEYL